MAVATTEIPLTELIKTLPGYDPYAFDESLGLWFDEEEAERRIWFIENALTFVEGERAGEPFTLEPWQKAFVGNLFGWKRADGLRRFNTFLLFVPRKNGKSPLTAAIVACVYFLDDEPGMQAYSVAGETQQASIVFKHCANMIRNNEVLKDQVDLYKYWIEKKKDPLSVYRYLTNKAESKHGFNTHLAVIDELHVCERDLVDAMRTSTSARRNPLVGYLTTSDYEREGSICNEVHDYACKIRDGVVDDPHFLPAIYEATREDDWEDEEVWAKANPNLGVSKKWEFMRAEFRLAKENPAFENEFKRLHLNIRTETSERLIPADKWALGNSDYKRTDYIGKQAIGAGLDLGNTSDLTELCLLFQNDDGGYDACWWRWTPEAKIREREKKHSAPYSTWVRQGYIQATPGDETDYATIRKDINDIWNQYGIADLHVDRLFQGVQLCQDLRADGVELKEFGQGFMSFAAPTVEFIKLVNKGWFRHGNDPVARWEAGNVCAELDAAGNMKPSKKKSGNKIDGIVAAIMAVAMASGGKPFTSTYNTRGVLAL